MIAFHNRSSTHKNRSELSRDAINVPHRTHIRTRNLIIKPQILHQKKYKKNLSFLNELMSMTVGRHFQRYSSVHSRRDEQNESKQVGLKYNGGKIAGTNRIFKNLPLKKESLYEKSLKKAKSIDQRVDFQQSIKQIAGKKFLNTKRSQLAHHAQTSTRFKTQLHHPQSATIIIELKRLFNSKAEYSFVKNDFEIIDKEEPIHSTAYTNINESEKHLTYSHHLHTRVKSASNKPKFSKGIKDSKEKRIKKESITISENDFIPWTKQSDRVLNEGEFQFGGNIFQRSQV